MSEEITLREMMFKDRVSTTDLMKVTGVSHDAVVKVREGNLDTSLVSTLKRLAAPFPKVRLEVRFVVDE